MRPGCQQDGREETLIYADMGDVDSVKTTRDDWDGLEGGVCACLDVLPDGQCDEAWRCIWTGCMPTVYSVDSAGAADACCCTETDRRLYLHYTTF